MYLPSPPSNTSYNGGRFRGALIMSFNHISNRQAAYSVARQKKGKSQGK